MWGIIRDITERKQFEQAIQTLSLVDELTGLYNRRGFVTLAEQQLKIAKRTRRDLYLIFADMDGLKPINDKYGHGVGDRLLCEVARMLRMNFRDSDIIARISGDEFVVLIMEPNGSSPEDLLQRLQARIAERNEHEFPPPLSVSAGLARFEGANPCSLEELLHQADALMYEEKRRKRAQAR
jgi:diguanylate cyclase (GGDEF)-like protein